LTGALHVLWLRLSPPPPSSLSAVKSKIWYSDSSVFVETGTSVVIVIWLSNPFSAVTRNVGCQRSLSIVNVAGYLLTGVDQPGFTRGCNFLLPVDITLKLDRTATGDSLSQAKKFPKPRKPAKGK